MKLLEAVKNVKIEDYELLENIKDCLEERLESLEFQEPDGDNDFFYEKWEEKMYELQEIFDEYENILYELDDFKNEDDEIDILLIDKKDVEEYNKKLEKLSFDIEMYQSEFGGLKRLKL